ncbi:MAG: hypothetical protein EBT24_06000 [Betaproteobacteria bacterium]|nr:hypothetical protein [Betaproteobacteria bacterium]
MGTQLRTMLAAAFLSAAPAVCYSEGFSVSPVRLHLGERERAVALRLGNEAQKELRLKAELYAWSQDEQGRDHLQPSDDLVVSPPRLRVPAQGEQVVRLILAAPRNPERQMTYRLLLREERDVLPESSGSVPISLALSLPIFVTPTVLVSISGPTQTRDVGPGLKTVTNTRQTVLLRDQAPKYWVLASGRWFSANAEGGPWMYVPGNELPEEFQQISETDGKIGSALASVPGTKAAKEAVVNNGLVRTVVLDRGKTQCDVKWNGQPAFTAINGTKLQYATNASQPVIKDGSAFYCCDSAAWFKASSASGPWSLCDNVPAEIYAIPASCPVYPVTFVEVYGSTADSVTFGFTAGYVGSYVQDGSIVYGTGYNYATLANDDGSSQTYPQTYGNQASYDQDSGIWAPPSGDAYADYYPAVYPAVYEGGWGGWGWYPGYATAWGYGYGHWGTWNNWNHYWNNWHPYYNHWNNGWHEWQRNDFNRHNLANQADANRNFRNTAGGWNSYAASRAEANTWNRANGVVQVNPNREEAREQRQVLGPNMNADARRDFGYHPTGFHPANQNVRRPGGNGAAHPAPAYHGGGAARGGGGGGRR